MSDEQDRLATFRKHLAYWEREARDNPNNKIAAESVEQFWTMIAKAELAIALEARQGKLFDVR